MSAHAGQRYSWRLRFIAILISAIFVLSWAAFFIGLKWFYNVNEWKKLTNIVLGIATLLMYGSVYGSFVHLIIIMIKPNIPLRDKLMWSVITAIPMIAFVLMFLFIDD
jgi:hypothetical protein